LPGEIGKIVPGVTGLVSIYHILKRGEASQSARHFKFGTQTDRDKYIVTTENGRSLGNNMYNVSYRANTNDLG